MQKYGSKRDKTLATKGWASQGGLVSVRGRKDDGCRAVPWGDRWRGRQIAPTTSWCSTRWSIMPQTKNGKRQSKQSAEAVDRSYQSWTLRQTNLPSSWWALIPARKKYSLCISRYTSSGDYWGLHPGEPELMEEVVSSFNDHQGWKQRRVPETAARSQPKDIWPPQVPNPERGRRESSVERSLANVRGGHQKGTGHSCGPGERDRVAQLPPWPGVIPQVENTLQE